MTMLERFIEPIPDEISFFMEALEQTRRSLAGVDWRELIRTSPTIRLWRFFLSQDPYTRWGLVKPRGYAGDATLMDFAYGHSSIQPLLQAAGQVGQEIYRHTSDAVQSRSARQRIALLTQALIDKGRESGSVSVLSFAAGHARELEELSPEAAARISRFTAIDTDATSLEAARLSAGSIPFAGVLRNVIKADLADLGTADLVYSLGLFDYLADGHARKVLSVMWAHTAPGGQLLAANLADDAGNLGYCEAIMDWWMIPRTEQQMWTLADGLFGPQGHVSVERHGCFHYLRVVRTD